MTPNPADGQPHDEPTSMLAATIATRMVGADVGTVITITKADPDQNGESQYHIVTEAPRA